ncbi:MAG: DUF1330 domain-containing protein [Sandaracinaceae bacterium]|nr:DUF1330 domain-containing protein [Sandaracinaceae bacterium]
MRTSVDPTPESFRALARDVPDGEPLVMLNLLRFREDAQYPEGSGHAPCAGRDAYARYAVHALPAVRAAGGDVIFHGPALSCPIAPPGESWDEVLIVRYPSRGAFLSMVMAPSYQRETVHRTAGLLDARLICAREG